MTGLLLVNLGTPDDPSPAAVRRYLSEFLSDPRVLDIGAVGRWALLNLVILPTRPAKSSEAYHKVWSADGSPIPDEHMQTILDDYARLEVSFPWQKGDVVLVDNVLVAHGRNPFRGKRKILVALGDMASYDQAGSRA